MRDNSRLEMAKSKHGDVERVWDCGVVVIGVLRIELWAERVEAETPVGEYDELTMVVEVELWVGCWEKISMLWVVCSSCCCCWPLLFPPNLW